MKGTRGENEEKKKGTLKEMNELYAEYCTYFGFHGTDEIDPKGPCHIIIYIYNYICNQWRKQQVDIVDMVT